MKFTLIAQASTVKPLVTNLHNFPDDSYTSSRIWYFYFDFSDSTCNYRGFDRVDGDPSYDDYPILDLSSSIQPLLDLHPEYFV